MPEPRFEQVIEEPDGVRTEFTLPTPYIAGSRPQPFLRGRPRVRTACDGAVELDPNAGTVKTNTPPKPGDVLMFMYLQPSPDGFELVSELEGCADFLDLTAELQSTYVEACLEAQCLDAEVDERAFCAEICNYEYSGEVICE